MSVIQRYIKVAKEYRPDKYDVGSDARVDILTDGAWVHSKRLDTGASVPLWINKWEVER